MVNASEGATNRVRSVETTAKTVDDAVARALAELACAREDVDVEVLHPGSPGRLLGFGAEPARVRVTRLTGAPAGGSRAAAGAGAAGHEAVAAVEETAEYEAEAEEEEGDAQENAETARRLLAELLLRMGLRDHQVDVLSEHPVLLNIRGGDVADLIGRRGENLRALQFILTLMVNKQLRRFVRITVDVDGYRARREELLRNMAHRLADRVRATGEALPLEAMPPNERRIVHISLADDPDVLTESVGEGDARRVVIRPRR